MENIKEHLSIDNIQFFNSINYEIENEAQLEIKIIEFVEKASRIHLEQCFLKLIDEHGRLHQFKINANPHQLVGYEVFYNETKLKQRPANAEEILQLIDETIGLKFSEVDDLQEYAMVESYRYISEVQKRWFTGFMALFATFIISLFTIGFIQMVAIPLIIGIGFSMAMLFQTHKILLHQQQF